MVLFTVIVYSFILLKLGSQSNAFVSKKQYNIEEHQKLFKDYLKEYNKHYVGEEFDERLEIFKGRLQEINELNEEAESAVFAINFFSDLTKEELQKYMSLKLSDKEPIYCENQLYTKTFKVPDTLDYRAQNLVTPVKDQHHPNWCGSCYAFSAVGVIEGQYAKKYNNTVSFSEQQIVDCDKGNSGCGGGSITVAFSYMSSAGLELLSDYPYTGVEGSCRHDPSKSKVKVASCLSLRFNNEEDVKYALYEYGPLSIALNSDKLLHYNGGILKDCPKTILNHGLVLVGYGTENNVPYWLIKNSWNTTWGEAGYLRLARGNVLCGMGIEVDVAFIE